MSQNRCPSKTQTAMVVFIVILNVLYLFILGSMDDYFAGEPDPLRASMLLALMGIWIWGTLGVVIKRTRQVGYPLWTFLLGVLPFFSIPFHLLILLKNSRLYKVPGLEDIFLSPAIRKTDNQNKIESLSGGDDPELRSHNMCETSIGQRLWDENGYPIQSKLIEPNILPDQERSSEPKNEVLEYLLAGRKYLKGSGVARNYKIAYAWFNAAAGQGCTESQKGFDKLEEILPMNTIIQAKNISLKDLCNHDALKSDWFPKQ